MKRKIKKIIPFIFFTIVICLTTQAQSIQQIFESIRYSHNLLTSFFSPMPKGGDLHHHYSGSVYAETYLEKAIEKDWFVNTKTLEILEQSQLGNTRFSEIKNTSEFGKIKTDLLRKWSIKDFGQKAAKDEHFFSTFMEFNLPVEHSFAEGLLEIKQRAKQENVSYIETIFERIVNNTVLTSVLSLNDSLYAAQKNKDHIKTTLFLQKLFDFFQQHNVKKIAQDYNQTLTQLHNNLKLDGDDFTIRYQNYVLRFMTPVEVFRDLITAFESCNTNPLIVGVNIVAPENGAVAMQDYWLHMQMYHFCKEQYPAVRYALHAGELCVGLVKPEDLTWHISEALTVAGAKRIGHGVAIAHETNAFESLEWMYKNNIPVEINLSSNEFILNISEDKHPIELYKKFNVPIVICSDDAGVLRTSLTEQFVLLAKRYKEFSYNDIKKIVFNSIELSMIKSEQQKNKMLLKLDADFNIFEKNIKKIFATMPRPTSSNN